MAAGVAYVPLDPSYPRDRLRLMQQDSGVSVVLCGSAEQAHLLELPTLSGAALPKRAASDLAHVMYTSGSTGRPKGVMVSQRAISRLVHARGYATLDANVVLGHGSNVSFDAATFEIWGALLHGARMVLIEQGTLLSPDALETQLKRHGITTLFLTTALVHRIADMRPTALQSLRELVFGGEAGQPQALAKLFAAGAPARVLNAYGPTENTTFSTCCELSAHDTERTVLPIGRSLSNGDAYVLDEQQWPLPLGAVGELVVTGDGLAEGYWQRPELTAQRFVTLWNGQRAYRTGDLARYLPHGQLAYLGRLDDQVKIRGFRIEPGEVRAVLCSHPAIRDALVVVDGTGADKQLVGYVVAGAPLDTEAQRELMHALRARLAQHLPHYMHPGALMVLDALPLNQNGKVDRSQLPRPVRVEAGEHEPLTTPTEHTIARVFSKVLGVSVVGRDANYFQLGGDSIKSVSVMEELRRAGLDCQLEHLFTYQTVGLLAAHLSTRPLAPSTHRELPDAYVRIAHGIVDRRDRYLVHVLGLSDDQRLYPMPLTQRKWLLHTFRHRSDQAWWVQVLFKVTEPDSEIGRLTRASFERAWPLVARAHGALHSRFHLENDRLYQILDPRTLPSVEEATLADEAALHGYIEQRMSEPFDLSRASPARMFVLQLDNGDRYHMLLIHHGIADGWTLGGIVDGLYRAAVGLPLATSSPADYADYIAWRLGRERPSLELSELDRTLRRAAKLPGWKSRRYRLRRRAGLHRPEFFLDAALSQRFYAAAKRLHVTPYLLIEAAWAKTIAQLAQADTVTFVVLDSGRNAPLPGIDTLLANTLAERAVVAQVELAEPAPQLIARLQTSRRAALEDEQQRFASNELQGLYDSLIVYENLPENADDAASPLSQLQAIDKYDPCPYRITLVVYQQPEISGFFEYFDSDFSERDFLTLRDVFLGHVRSVVHECVQDAGRDRAAAQPTERA